VGWDTCSQSEPANSSRSASASLWWRLIVGLVTVSLLAVAAASALLYVRFKAKNSEFREQTLSLQAGVIEHYLATAPEGPINLPSYVTEGFRVNHGRYAIVTADGTLLAASPGETHSLAAVDPKQSRASFVLEPDEQQVPYYGLSVRTSFGDRPIWIQVAFHAGNIVFDSVLEEFVQDIAWIWIPFILILLLVNLVVARVGLTPLRVAATQAAAIGPDSVSVRLTETGLPRDVHALVTAVNRGLDRLETAFGAQRRFISDAAHELRTPVAVIKAHLAVLTNFTGRAELVDEINGLERLVNQMLDFARLDALEIGPSDEADLVEVATDAASHFGPTAIQANRSIEVLAPYRPVLIRGARDFMSRAVRNIVENALRFTPEGTTVSVQVTANPPAIRVVDHGPGVRPEERHAMFTRFWQGGRDKRGGAGGAGLGLDIAARTVVAHGGIISVGDAPGGGAMFSMEFEPVALKRGGSGIVK